ncbi:LOW QUALITY PROTEIN: hypothetical protein QC764_600020 [Podospora pseudoanserina]|uniref:Cytochrome P450 E-class, group IV n=1 Tax=Podospora pseudoanserina TaxID=2609844 RepID=A0ABR0HTN3_9PEZI|nr:LOW QUALITY PROTEIN: hypothetical protein QC764_600020 [Podospora pseudoanserina]
MAPTLPLLSSPASLPRSQACSPTPATSSMAFTTPPPFASSSSTSPRLLLFTTLFLSYLTALFTSIIIYRLFFHPLRHIRSLFLAKITKLTSLYAARNGQKHLEQAALFEKYGNFVRVAPNEVFMCSVEGIRKIHVRDSGCRKLNAGVYDVIHSEGEYNLDSIMTREEHAPRRKVCHTWLAKVASFNGKPIDTSLFSLLISFDHMGKVEFSHEFRSISRKGTQDATLSMFGEIGQMGELTWLLSIAQNVKLSKTAAEFDQLTMLMADRRAAAEDNNKGDILQHFLDDMRSEKSIAFTNKNILYSDAALVLTGATDTIGAVLAHLFYQLANHPHYQDLLHVQFQKAYGKTIPDEFTNQDLSKISLLDALINETMRVDNLIASNDPRQTPPEGITVDGVHIPGGVAVRVPAHALHRSEQFYAEPAQFRPERWLDDNKEYVKNAEAFIPFLVGPNNCVGKRMTMSVLRLVMAYTVYNYTWEKAPGEDWKRIRTESKDNLILKAGPFEAVFLPR